MKGCDRADWLGVLIVSILIVKKPKDCSGSGDHDRVGSVGEVRLRFGGVRQGSDIEAGACGNGGDDSGKGEKSLLHSWIPS